jgi:hypothetical protein
LQYLVEKNERSKTEGNKCNYNKGTINRTGKEGISIHTSIFYPIILAVSLDDMNSLVLAGQSSILKGNCGKSSTDDQ